MTTIMKNNFQLQNIIFIPRENKSMTEDTPTKPTKIVLTISKQAKGIMKMIQVMKSNINQIYRNSEKWQNPGKNLEIK